MATLVTEFCPVRLNRTYPLFKSQTIAVLSNDTPTTLLLSLLMATLFTLLVCRVIGIHYLSPTPLRYYYQTDPVTTLLLSLLMATQFTEAVCPVRLSNLFPVFKSQTIAVLSKAPETILVLSLLMATLIT